METPIDPKTIPHSELDTVIKWLGIGFEAPIKRKSDGAKMFIRVISEESYNEKRDELEKLRKFHRENDRTLATQASALDARNQK